MGSRGANQAPPPASLELFGDTAPSLEQAWKIVERFPLNARFFRTMKSCMDSCCKDGPSHGPYWHAHYTRDGKRTRIYVGTDERKRAIERAHEVVRQEITAAEQAAAPQIARVAELHAAAFIPRRGRPAGAIAAAVALTEEARPKARALRRR